MAGRALVYVLLAIFSCFFVASGDVHKKSINPKPAAKQSTRVKRQATQETPIQVYQLTQADRDRLLDMHNGYRRNSNSSDSRQMTWDDQLATFASTYVSNCRFAHSDSADRDEASDTFGWVGENLAISWTSSSNLDQSYLFGGVEDWHDEIEHWNFETNSCNPGKVCGHYTQVVWADTYKLGCGAAFCTDSNPTWHHSFLVSCLYGPGGNVGGQSVFESGEACTACSTTDDVCVDGLCSNQQRGDEIPRITTTTRPAPTAPLRPVRTTPQPPVVEPEETTGGPPQPEVTYPQPDVTYPEPEQTRPEPPVTTPTSPTVTPTPTTSCPTSTFQQDLAAWREAIGQYREQFAQWREAFGNFQNCNSNN